MSRRSSRRPPLSNSRLERDLTTPIARAPTISLLPIKRSILEGVADDLRRNYPTIAVPAFSQPRSASRLVFRSTDANLKSLRNLNRNDGSKGNRGYTPSFTARVAFSEPKHVAVCARRHIRREVLHAFGVAGGKGVGRNRKQHRNEWSKVGC